MPQNFVEDAKLSKSTVYSILIVKSNTVQSKSQKLCFIYQSFTPIICSISIHLLLEQWLLVLRVKGVKNPSFSALLSQTITMGSKCEKDKVDCCNVSKREILKRNQTCTK